MGDDYSKETRDWYARHGKEPAMNDLPTLYRIAITDDWVDDPRDVIEDLIADGALIPVTEPLLTREEAANDPEVQEMVREAFAVKWRVKGEYR